MRTILNHKKSYCDYIAELKSDYLYNQLINNGLFCDKLPPIFDMSNFVEFVDLNPGTIPANAKHPVAFFYSVRNTGFPRNISICTPITYYNLCKTIKKYWDPISKYFYDCTNMHKHKVSRIHIRKMDQTKNKGIFSMNYSNFHTDDSPELDLSLGKKYVVKADISKCFDSIYTHSIPWAVLGKNEAKRNRNKTFSNKLDVATRNTTDGETHGLPIGPHTSNILSEILLCKIDKKLSKKWSYVRYIDDYKCFVNTVEEAENFLSELNMCLKLYGLTLNHSKSHITRMPICDDDDWVLAINNYKIHLNKSLLDYKDVKAFLNFMIALMKTHNNESIFLYGLKMIKRKKLTSNAVNYLAKTVCNLVFLYPYLIPYLDNILFSKYNVEKGLIDKFLNIYYEDFITKDLQGPLSFVFYYAIKYDICLKNFCSCKSHINKINSFNDCVLSLCCSIYCLKNKLSEYYRIMKEYANQLCKDNEFYTMWPFTYEILTLDELKSLHVKSKKQNILHEHTWISMKENDVSFVKNEYIYN